MTKRTQLISFFSLIFILLFQTAAQASLLIAPLRVVFDDRERGKSVSVINTSDKTATYRISMINLQQLASGKYNDLSKPDALPVEGYFAKDMIRFSPRQVTLKPGERQKVRLSLRKPANLAEGEYRSHLKFTQLPSPEMLNTDPNQVGIKLYMLSGFSIPVHVRQGVIEVQSQITSAKITRNKQGLWQLATEIKRQGDFSSFGKLSLLWRASANEDYEEVTFLNNVSLYRETPKRTLTMVVPDKNIKKGQYKVVYSGDNAFQNKIFAEYTFNY